MTSASTASTRQPAKTAWLDAELEGAGAGLPRVGQCVVRPVLREPQPGAALKQQRARRARRPAARLLFRGGQCGVGAVEVVRLDENVDEERQRPEHRRRGCHAQLVLECEPGVRLGVTDLACLHERHRPEHAAVGERDQPAARARNVDQGVAQAKGDVQLVVDDQMRHRPGGQQRSGLGGEDVLFEHRPQQSENLARRLVLEPVRRPQPPPATARAPAGACIRSRA